jgi:Uma2 family endonuclease
MTVEEYHRVSLDLDLTELVGGVMIVHDPRPLHGMAHARLIAMLGIWTEAMPGRGMTLAPVGMDLTEYDSYAPDVLWFAEANVPSDLRQALMDVPDLIAEVRSPSTWHYDRGHKRDVYEAAGLPELWLVDPEEEAVTACRRSTPDTPVFDVELRFKLGETLRSPQLPGFELPLERIFRR